VAGRNHADSPQALSLTESFLAAARLRRVAERFVFAKLPARVVALAKETIATIGA